MPSSSAIKHFDTPPSPEISADPDHNSSIDITETLANFENNSFKHCPQSDDDDDDDDDFIRSSSKKAIFKAGSQAIKSTQSKKKTSSSITGGGSFQSLGLHPSLLRAILLRGFNTPTPIQRAALPHILASPPRDVVGMARTGSGKTLAYLIPLIQALGGTHSIQFGIRALIILPTRELALQILKVAKDLSKGFVQGFRSTSDSQQSDHTTRKMEALRWGLVVGSDSLEDQFTMFASNPDVIIATPGRLLHLVVEMNLDLKSVTYVVFDEADRLFEMGFATQLEETLHRLPPNRQTLLFSATLPKSLVEFAKAGLQNPKLIRLDSESKISSDLQMAFLSVKPIEKEAALFTLINDIVGVPKTEAIEEPNANCSRRGTGSNFSKVRVKPNHELASHQTIVFTATKHHVEYLGGLLIAAGYQVSLIYGSLDQTARFNQLIAFRTGRTQILVVTDLAARGIDIPILENVINYDFPSSARAFVHRVGRTARAGRKGWAYSLITRSELPFLMDLQLFLSRPLVTCPVPPSIDSTQIDFSSNLVIGTVPRDRLDAETEYVRETLISSNSALIALGTVVKRAQKMYEKSQCTASNESYRRSKEFILNAQGFGAVKNQEGNVHLIFKSKTRHQGIQTNTSQKDLKPEQDRVLRDALIAKVNLFTPNETVFEIGTGGKSPAAQLMRERRKSMGNLITRAKEASKVRKENLVADQALEKNPPLQFPKKSDGLQTATKTPPAVATEAELEETFEMPRKRKKEKQAESFRDPTAYLGYEQIGAAAEKGYNLNEGTSTALLSQSKRAIFDLGVNDDEGTLKSISNAQKASQVKWDRKTKKFVKVDQVGKDNIKLIKTESGLKLPVSFKTGSFENWKKTNKIKLPKVGDQEIDHPHSSFNNSINMKFRHQSIGSDNNRKLKNGNDGQQINNHQRNQKNNKVFKKTIDGQKKFLGPTHVITRGSNSKSNFSGRHRKNGKSPAGAGLKSVDQIRKAREMKESRKQRSNHLPSSHRRKK